MTMNPLPGRDVVDPDLGPSIPPQQQSEGEWAVPVQRQSEGEWDHGRHHPDVDRWADLVRLFWNELGLSSEIDYALMVMWGESNGNPGAVGPRVAGYTGRPAEAHGLFQHMSDLWPDRLRQAQQFWAARGIPIGSDWNDPLTNIAVAAWLRNVGGWGHWEVTHRWYPQGSWGPTTFWNGYQYVNMALPSPQGGAPQGDGRIAGASSTGAVTTDGWTHPVPGAPVIAGSNLYGQPRTGHTHAGVDINAPGWRGQRGYGAGHPVQAAGDGRVIYAQKANDSAGYVVQIQHRNGWISKYMHLGSKDGQVEPFAVTVGQTVRAGQVIGFMGDTGNPAAGAYHLHFEMWNPEGNAVDPVTTGIFEAIGQVTEVGRYIGGRQAGNQIGSRVGDFYRTPRDRARALLGAQINAISMDVAGGARKTLAEIRAERGGPRPFQAVSEQGWQRDPVTTAGELAAGTAQELLETQNRTGTFLDILRRVARIGRQVGEQAESGEGDDNAV